MSGDRDADFVAGLLGDIRSELEGNRRISRGDLLHLLLLLFLFKLRNLLGDRTFRDRKDREFLPALVALVDSRADLLDVIGNLGQQDDVRAGGHACGQSQPAYLVSHDFHDEDAAV